MQRCGENGEVDNKIWLHVGCNMLNLGFFLVEKKK
jgi:hypothetical protein